MTDAPFTPEQKLELDARIGDMVGLVIGTGYKRQWAEFSSATRANAWRLTLPALAQAFPVQPAKSRNGGRWLRAGALAALATLLIFRQRRA